MGIHRGIGAFKSFTKRNKQMNEKFDTILEELEKTRSDHKVVYKNISGDYNIRK